VQLVALRLRATLEQLLVLLEQHILGLPRLLQKRLILGRLRLHLDRLIAIIILRRRTHRRGCPLPLRIRCRILCPTVFLASSCSADLMVNAGIRWNSVHCLVPL
jgi:hypothetical protein